MDSDKDSEYDSAIEEEEFRLYSQLYFEPNPEHEPLAPITNNEENSEIVSNAQNNASPTHQEIRKERTSSICSVESISGNKPLDDLYSQIQIPDEEIEQLGLELLKNQRLAPVDEEEISSERGALKRKRSASSSSDSEEEVIEEEEDEESRCSLILNKGLKTKTKSTAITIDDDGDGRTQSFHDSSEEIVLLPSELHKVSVINLSSDSEDGLDVASDKTAKQYASSQENDSKNKAQSKGKKSLDYINTKKEKSSKKNPKKKKARRTSHSDTDSFSESELQLFTPLTMNVDQNLSKLFRGSQDDDDDIQVVPTTAQRALDYTKGRDVTVKIPSCPKWTAEMATFYDSDVSEDLFVEDVHQQQSDSRRDWKIINADNPIQWGRRYFNSKRCIRCRQFDHTVDECPRVPVCHLCSESDHTLRHQCPKNCCLRCGGKPHRFCTDTVLNEVCKSCGYTGHRSYLCPEQWRKFHITTSGEQAKAPSTLRERPKARQYCSLCGQRGHYNYNCNNNRSEYYGPVPQIVSSYDSHSDVLFRGETSAPEMNYGLPSEIIVPKKRMTTVDLKQREVGLVMGHRGVIIKEIQKRSKSRLIVNTDNIKQPKIEIYGSKVKQTTALGLVQVLLGDLPPEDFTDFLTKVSVINKDPHIIETVLAAYRKKTNVDGAKKTKKMHKGKLTKGIKPKKSSHWQENQNFSNNFDPNEIDEYEGPKMPKKRKKMKQPNESDGLEIPKKGKKKNSGKKGRKCKHKQAKSKCTICKDNQKTKKKKQVIKASTSSQNEYHDKKIGKKRQRKRDKFAGQGKPWSRPEPFIHWTKLNGL